MKKRYYYITYVLCIVCTIIDISLFAQERGETEVTGISFASIDCTKQVAFCEHYQLNSEENSIENLVVRKHNRQLSANEIANVTLENLDQNQDSQLTQDEALLTNETWNLMTTQANTIQLEQLQTYFEEWSNLQVTQVTQNLCDQLDQNRDELLSPEEMGRYISILQNLKRPEYLRNRSWPSGSISMLECKRIRESPKKLLAERFMQTVQDIDLENSEEIREHVSEGLLTSFEAMLITEYRDIDLLRIYVPFLGAVRMYHHKLDTLIQDHDLNHNQCLDVDEKLYQQIAYYESINQIIGGMSTSDQCYTREQILEYFNQALINQWRDSFTEKFIKLQQTIIHKSQVAINELGDRDGRYYLSKFERLVWESSDLNQNGVIDDDENLDIEKYELFKSYFDMYAFMDETEQIYLNEFGLVQTFIDSFVDLDKYPKSFFRAFLNLKTCINEYGETWQQDCSHTTISWIGE